MATIKLKITEHSIAGRKLINQDFIGHKQPSSLHEKAKGQAFILADGISSSKVSHIASKTAVTNFLKEYYASPDIWTVEKSAKTVVSAINSWLYKQGMKLPSRYDKDKGFICTFTAVILRSNTAHVMHVGDSRLALIRNGKYHRITNVHRREVSQEVSYLTRGLGIQATIDIDYHQIPLHEKDLLLISTDGFHDWYGEEDLLTQLEQREGNLETTAESLVNSAYEKGSDDNISLQMIAIEQLPERSLDEIGLGIEQLKIPPILVERKVFEGYEILRKLYVGPRSQVYQVKHQETETVCVMKIPSENYKDDLAYLEQFLLEEWIAKRINNVNVLKTLESSNKSYIYTITEYIEGQTLRQWMIDHPEPSFAKVRDIIAQIAKGLNAFHKHEMIYQDLRPENIMINQDGMVKIIDFGAVLVPGIEDMRRQQNITEIPGTARYSAPEYFLGREPKTNADLFSLAIITYEMCAGKLPYGLNLGKAKTQRDINRLKYQPLQELDLGLPYWLDNVLKKALEIDRNKRFQDVSEFVFELNTPAANYISPRKLPLIEKHPVQFWKVVAAILFVIVIIQFIFLF